MMRQKNGQGKEETLKKRKEIKKGKCREGKRMEERHMGKSLLYQQSLNI